MPYHCCHRPYHQRHRQPLTRGPPSYFHHPWSRLPPPSPIHSYQLSTAVVFAPFPYFDQLLSLPLPPFPSPTPHSCLAIPYPHPLQTSRPSPLIFQIACIHVPASESPDGPTSALSPQSQERYAFSWKPAIQSHRRHDARLLLEAKQHGPGRGGEKLRLGSR